jgi:hypothetical protein
MLHRKPATPEEFDHQAARSIVVDFNHVGETVDLRWYLFDVSGREIARLDLAHNFLIGRLASIPEVEVPIHASKGAPDWDSYQADEKRRGRAN